MVQDGGLLLAIIARYSALPSHYTTAVFASCGMGFWTFLIAAIVSLPTQFANVYLGTTFENTSADSTEKIVNYVSIGITTITTFAAQWFIRRKLNQAKTDVIYARRKARKANISGFYQEGSSVALVDGARSQGLDEESQSYDPYMAYPPRSYSRTPSE